PEGDPYASGLRSLRRIGCAQEKRLRLCHLLQGRGQAPRGSQFRNDDSRSAEAGRLASRTRSESRRHGSNRGVLVNPHPIKVIPGRKTDTKDCEWIADLLQHGLVRGSFVPPTDIQDLRDLTRYRAELKQAQCTVANRIQK